MILLFDIGNTRVKWATLDARGISVQSAQVYSDWDEAKFSAAVLEPSERPERVLVSNVGGTRIAAIVRDSIRQRWGIEAEFVRTSAAACGVRNAYPEPANLGVDRWLGVIAAHQLKKRLTCIVGIGTAMTIDGIDAQGQHLGGVIAPGPDLMVASLLRNTSDIARKAEQGSTSDALFADNTLGAIHQGSAHALAALIERAVASMQAQAGETPSLILTGGFAPIIGRLIHLQYELIPDLVLQGLARLASATTASG